MVGAGLPLGRGEADAAENRKGDCACVNEFTHASLLMSWRISDQSRYRHDPSRQTRDDEDLIVAGSLGSVDRCQDRARSTWVGSANVRTWRGAWPLSPAPVDAGARVAV